MKRPLHTAAMLGTLLVARCAQEDRRIAEDHTSCEQMGHTPGTATFRQCMIDLNERRCATVTANFTGSQHVATWECTRIPAE